MKTSSYWGTTMTMETHILIYIYIYIYTYIYIFPSMVILPTMVITGYHHVFGFPARQILYKWASFHSYLKEPESISGWWLINPSEQSEFVSWDDDIPNWMESHKIPWFQTTNQIYIYIYIYNWIIPNNFPTISQQWSLNHPKKVIYITIIPFLAGIFHCKPSSYWGSSWGTPMTMETRIVRCHIYWWPLQTPLHRCLPPGALFCVLAEMMRFSTRFQWETYWLIMGDILWWEISCDSYDHWLIFWLSSGKLTVGPWKCSPFSSGNESSTPDSPAKRISPAHDHDNFSGLPSGYDVNGNFQWFVTMA